MIEAKVVLTDAARHVVEQVKAKRGGNLSLVIGNGCCDSTAPFMFADYMAGPTEYAVGELAGVIVFVDELVARTFDGTEVVVDVEQGPEPDSFSCESELGYRFKLDRLPGAT